MRRWTSFIGFGLAVMISIEMSAQTSGQKLSSDLPPSLHPGDISVGFIKERTLDNRVPKQILLMPRDKSYFSEYVFLADKSARSLSIWSLKDKEPTRVGHFPTDIGKKKGDKTVMGDHRTPEGVYFFQENFKGKELDYNLYGSQAFSTNYPNLFDRRESKTGSGIWLHAVPDETPLTRGSRGCVVVRDKIINKMPNYIRLRKTPIIITAKAEYLPQKKWKNRSSEMLNWLESWRTAWSSGDMERYMTFYSKEDFRSQRKRFSAWKSYKKRIARQNSSMRVELTRAVGFQDRDTAILEFLQKYKSDTVEDYGKKSLYLQKERGAWKIVAEHWRAVTRDQWLAEYHLDQVSNESQTTTVGSFAPTASDQL